MDLMSTLQVLGSVGEFVGAIGVVITLIFVAVQVSHSRQAMEQMTAQRQADAVRTFSDSISGWMMEVFGNPELADLVVRGRAGQPLDDLEWERFMAVASQFFVHNRLVYVAAMAAGNEGQGNMTVQGTAFNIAEYPGMARVWRERLRQLTRMVAPDFVAAVDAEAQRMQTEADAG